MRQPTRTLLVYGMLVSMFFVSSRAEARFNPLRYLTTTQVRSDVVVILDTTGSLASGVCPSCTGVCTNVSGGDCYGDRSSEVDICGDGLCSGVEDATTCAADCTLTSNDTPLTLGAAPAGQAPSCSANHVSRLAMAKRALRTVLPEFRAAANIGLVTIPSFQSKLYRYFRAESSLPVKQVSIFLSEIEMKRLNGWNFATNEPNSAFVWPLPAPRTGVSLTLTSAGPLAIAKDSLYRRADDASIEKRFAWSIAGRRHRSGGYDWLYSGSYYSYAQSAIQPSLSQREDFPADTSAPLTFEAYRGPQFTDGTGITWVYQRFGPSQCLVVEQGIDGSTPSADFVQPLIYSTNQADYENAFAKLLGHLNSAPNGGLVAVGNRSALGSAIALAGVHLAARGNFPPATNSVVTCHPRMVVLITDAQTEHGTPSGADAAATLLAKFPGKPIRTHIIALPGAGSGLLDGIAAAGGTSAALPANNEAELAKHLRDVLLSESRTDFTTTAPGVATSFGSAIRDNIALFPTTDFPGWRGHLKAVDLRSRCGPPFPPPHLPCQSGQTCVAGRCQLWDAATKLNTSDWRARSLFSGVHDIGAGAPIALLANDGSGAPCLNAGAAPGCHTSTGLNDIWVAATQTPAPPDLGAMLQWIAGRDRVWKLPAIINSVPSGVGPPPSFDGKLPGHEELTLREASRQRLVYVASSEGILHAFDLQDGREMFGYIPAHLLPKIYALFRQGGQSTLPGNFQWILANSPRVEDLQDSSGRWQTVLVQTSGPGSEDFAVLDITNPSTCGSLSDSSTCSRNPAPFRITFSSRRAVPSIASTIAESWSVPALYWTSAESPRASMGSGYDRTTGEGSYYNHFKSIAAPAWESVAPADISTYLLDGTPALVPDYSVFADTSAVLDPSGPRHVIATYQADLAGRITRFAAGDTSTVSTVFSDALEGGAGYPIYFSPAALYRSDLNVVTFGALTGAFQEEGTSGFPSFESRMVVRAESGGTINPTVDNISCPISDLCSATCFPGGVPATCAAPSAAAKPTSSPLIFLNQLFDDRLETFAVVHDPRASECIGDKVSVGRSWTLRIVSEGNGLIHRLESATPHHNTLISGISIAGNNSDIVLSQTQGTGARASISTLSGDPVGGGGTFRGVPIIESWREVP